MKIFGNAVSWKVETRTSIPLSLVVAINFVFPSKVKNFLSLSSHLGSYSFKMHLYNEHPAPYDLQSESITNYSYTVSYQKL